MVFLLYLIMWVQRLNYSLKKSIKVHRCLPALNKSIVLLYESWQCRDSIVHIDNLNKQVFSHNFDQMIHSLCMPNQQQVMVLLVAKNQVLVIDLVSHSVRHYNYQFKIEVSCQVRIQAFCQSKMVLFCENGTYNQPLIKLSYFYYPFKDFQSGQIEPSTIFQDYDGAWTYQYSIRKGNNHSIMIWFRSRHEDQIEIRTFDLRKDPKKGSFRMMRIKNTLGQPYGVDKINFTLQEVWEMKPGTFCLVGNSDKAQKKCFNARDNVINNYIWDIEKRVIRQAHFQMPGKADDFVIDCMSCGQFSMFRSFAFNNEKTSIDSPAIFVHNSTQQIYETQNGKCTHLNHWFVPEYSNCLFVEVVYDHQKVNEIAVFIKMMIPHKVRIVHLLVSSKQYVFLDQDLIQETIELLDDQSI